mmetsp:Transcript_7667/g.15600  ORF Transcript_7667/g.15600 Transcript_7667/m.15600 type:complete len:598 (-) Transcript_7667:52-1845(-)
MAEAGLEPQLEAGFRRALEELAVRRPRTTAHRPPLHLRIKSLALELDPANPPPPPPDALMASGYEDIILRRLRDLMTVHMDPTEEQRQLRAVMTKHSSALEDIFKYYAELDLGAFLCDAGSAIDEDLQDQLDKDVTYTDPTNLVQSMFTHGRLHTRQWMQLIQDTKLANNTLSVADLNRLAAYCMFHPAVEDKVQFEPHSPFSNRLGYYEWIEVLLRVAWQQYPKYPGHARRFETLLNECILPRGGKDSRDEITRSLWASDMNALQVYVKDRPNLYRMFSYFSSKFAAGALPTDLTPLQKMTKAIQAKMKEFEEGSGMQDQVNNLKRSLSKNSDKKDIAAVVNAVMAPCRTPAVKNWGQAMDAVKASLKQSGGASSTPASGGAASTSQPESPSLSHSPQPRMISLLNPDLPPIAVQSPSPDRLSRRVSQSGRLSPEPLTPVQESSNPDSTFNSTCPPRVRRHSMEESASMMKSITRVAAVGAEFSEGDKPMNANNVLRVLEKLELFSPALNYQIARKIMCALLNNKEILPQQHPKNDVVEVVFEQFVEMLARFALAQGGAAARKTLKDEGAWALLDGYLRECVFPVAMKAIPGKFIF